MAPVTRIRRSLLFLIAGAVLVLAACDPATRIEGDLRLAAGKQAPDDARHTLFVAAYPKAAGRGRQARPAALSGEPGGGIGAAPLAGDVLERAAQAGPALALRRSGDRQRRLQTAGELGIVAADERPAGFAEDPGAGIAEQA